MSYSSSIGSGRDHTSAVAAAAASLPTKRSHKMMDTKSTNNESVCTTTLFASGMERLKAAQIELINAQNNMESIRQQIRNSGDVEPDSLLCLCDKEDNYILSNIMNYLTVDDLGRCELVFCSTLNKQAKKIIDKLDGVHITNYTGKEPVPKDVTFVSFHPCVLEISKETFKDCIKLRNVVLNEGLLTIRKRAFSGCKSLTSITLPSTLLEIDCYAFEFCCNLEKAVLNDGLQELGNGVFESCTSLGSIILPALSKVGFDAFMKCSSLKYIKFNEECRKIGRLEQLPENKWRYDYDGERVSHSREVVLHDIELRSIEPRAFFGCKSLESIKLPSTIREIHENMFNECSNLREVVLHEGVWSIGHEAFYACESLKSITLPSSIDEIGYEAFVWCTNLREVILSVGKEKFKAGYGYRTSSLNQIDESGFYLRMGRSAFAGCPALESFQFPYIAARLEHIICAGHADIMTKIDEIRGLFEWRGNELLVPTSAIRNLRDSAWWNSVRESLKKIVNLLAFYEFKEATVLFELALWKAKIDQEEEGTNPIERSACRTEVPRKVKDTILQFMFRGYGN